MHPSVFDSFPQIHLMMFKEHLSDQRVSVAVEPAGGDPDQFVPYGHTRPVDELGILNDPNGKPRQVVFPFFVKPGHFSGFAADQRALRFDTAFDDTRDDGLPFLRVQIENVAR